VGPYLSPTSAYKIAEPVFEAVPELPQPDWKLLADASSTGYQPRETLERQNRKLTEHLGRAQTIIQAHELIEEGREAQLIVQHAELTKLNQSLHAKENRPKDDRTILFPGGFGRHLTDSEFGQQLEAQNQRKAEKAAEKARKKGLSEANKAARAAVDAEWKEIIAEHKAVEAWEVECARLKEAGIRVKDLPAKPKRPPKPKPVLDVPVGGGEPEDQSSSDV
jgi:uncharacterized glyoxalase superfamily protein PhnB